MTRLLPLPAARPWSAAALLPPLLSSALRSIFQRQSSRPLRIPSLPPVYAPFRRFPAKRSSRNSFPCHSYKIFHSPYPASPLFATLTQTWRVSIIASHSGTRSLPTTRTSAPLFCTKRQKSTPCFQQLAHSFAIKGEAEGEGTILPDTDNPMFAKILATSQILQLRQPVAAPLRQKRQQAQL